MGKGVVMALSEKTKKAVVLLLEQEVREPSGRFPCVMSVVNGARRETDIALSDEIERFDDERDYGSMHDWYDHV